MEITEIIGLIALIIIGLNLAANNILVSILVTYVFYRDKTAGVVLRIAGIIMAFSSLLIIFNNIDYAIYANMFIIILLIFLSIRARNRAFSEKMNARDKLLKEYEEEIKRKRERVHELKKKGVKGDDDQAPFGVEAQSVSDIKKKMWNDGSMTNKELISGFKKDK